VISRHRSSVVELSIRNRVVVGSTPTGGSFLQAAPPTGGWGRVVAALAYRRTKCQTVRALLDSYRDEPFGEYFSDGDLVITDNSMPRMTGTEVIGHLSERASESDHPGDVRPVAFR
jgi:CheY-like chemotaxis protein